MIKLENDDDDDDGDDRRILQFAGAIVVVAIAAVVIDEKDRVDINTVITGSVSTYNVLFYLRY